MEPRNEDADVDLESEEEEEEEEEEDKGKNQNVATNAFAKLKVEASNADSSPSGAQASSSSSSSAAGDLKQDEPQPPSSTSEVAFHPKPTVIIVIGMAGSGKTALLQRLVSHVHLAGKRGYVLNLDPAVTYLPFSANIDIRDTVNYKNVMKEYNLGPNGGILTSLNLFATKFDEVVGLVEKRAHQLDYVLVDTPGQIEIFTWSASGAIITEAFASTFPTVVTYVLDTPRSASPPTFMSNMLYACGILYKTRLPLLLAFNKTDVTDHGFGLKWMEDFQAFQAAIENDTSYSSNLSRSLCLVLDEFYQNLHNVGVSAVTGAGMDEFLVAVDKCTVEYMENYKVELEARRRERDEREAERRTASMARLAQDIAGSQGQQTVLQTPRRGANVPEEEEEEEEDSSDPEDEDME